MMTTTFLVFAILATVAIVIFNRLVNDRNQALAAWSDIDVQLTRRHDLVPSLVKAVKAYAGYEQATLTAVTELRARSEAAQHLGDRARFEDEMVAGINRLVALAEAYPDLKADQNFLELQQELSAIEDHLQYSRRFYNGSVRIYNTRLESFPDMIVARAFGFQPREFFAVDADEIRALPQVDLGARH